MFRSSNHSGNSQEGLEARLKGVEAHVQALTTEKNLEQRVEILEGRVQVLEAAANDEQIRVEGADHFQKEVIKQIEDLESSCKAEVSEKFLQLSEAVAKLVEECTICASKSSVESLRQEITALKGTVCEEQADHHRLAEQGAQIDRLRGALSGDGQQLRNFMDEETLRKNNLRVEGATAEWLVRDVETWIGALPRGEFLESPAFAVEAPGAGRLDGLRLRFFPNGGANVTSAGNCSLYLEHPVGMPWAQYELIVGQCRRGTFDPIFTGSDDFCALAPELYPLGDVRVVRLCVRFLPLNRLPVAPMCEASQRDIVAHTAFDAQHLAATELSVPDLASRYAAPAASWGEAPHQGRLWLASNRTDA